MRSRTYLHWTSALAVVPVVLAGCDAGDAATEPLVEPISYSVVGPGPQATSSLGPVYRFNGRTQFADANFWSETADGYTSGVVNVFQDASGGSDTTALYYSVWSCSYETWDCVAEDGYGSIPGRDVRFGQNSVSLSTNTSFDANPDFGRGSGEGGLVEVDWKTTSFYSNDAVINERSTYGNITVTHHANSSYSSALADGNVVAFSFNAADGSIGNEHNVSMEISVANVVASASGSGHITVNDELRTFSFHALLTSDGRAGGEWQRYNRASGAMAHGKVTCMSLAGNQAWLGGVTSMTTTVAGGMFWRVVDGGAGASAQDQISLQQPTGEDLWMVEDYCWNQYDTPPLLPIEAGQIKVRQ